MPSCPLKSPCVRKTVSLDMLTRRNWVKRFAIGSAVALGLEQWKGTLLADLSPGVNPANVLSFKVSDYPILQTEYGSIRLSLFGSAVPNGVITITRGQTPPPPEPPVFYSTSAWCTHE